MARVITAGQRITKGKGAYYVSYNERNTRSCKERRGMSGLRDEDQKDCRRNTGNLFLSDMPAQKMRTIGLTGVMGAGKSSVIRI